jgi:hypothetical protein
MNQAVKSAQGKLNRGWEYKVNSTSPIKRLPQSGSMMSMLVWASWKLVIHEGPVRRDHSYVSNGQAAYVDTFSRTEIISHVSSASTMPKREQSIVPVP